MWRLNPPAKLPPTPVSDRYRILYNDTQWKEGNTVDENKIFMVRWDRMLSLRCLKEPFIDIDVKSKAPKQLVALRYPSQERVVLVTNTKERESWQSQWPTRRQEVENLCRTDYWDDAFSRGQLIATDWRPLQLANGWSKLQSQPWQKKTTGFYKGDIRTGSDSRTFDNRNDGIAYNILSVGVTPPPSDAVYIKLSPRSRGSRNNRIPGNATQLVDGDQPACANAGVTNKGIYVAKTTIDLLCGGSYKWKENLDKLYIRIYDGGIFRLSVPNDSKILQKASFWQDAYDYGIQAFEGNISRARNPDGLQLLFVVSQRSRIKVEGLTTLVTEVQKKHPTIKQRAKVVSEAAPSADKDVFNYKLSISPFGDIETWIKESDYVAYLTAYPVHPFPEDVKTITDVNLEVAPGATAFQLTLQDKLKKQVEESEKHHSVEPSAMSSTVSNATIAAAARQRDSVAKEGKQVGASATDFARAFRWVDVDDYVGNVTKGGIRWDATGNKPAEWLHRCAYSWGSPLGKEVNQSSKNLVFGSSESNGLMIRYERAWQDLFKSEARGRRARKTAGVAVPADDFEGTLTTTNTSARRAILTQTVGGDKTSIRSTWYRKGLTEDNKGKPKIRVFAFSPIYGESRNPTSKDLSEDDPEYKDYWDWTQKQPLMCFHLL